MSQTIAFYPVKTDEGWAVAEFREHVPGYEIQPQFTALARESAEFRANELNAELGISDRDVQRIVTNALEQSDAA